MSRRSGQDGYIERKGNCYVVRFWMDQPKQEKRVHKSIRICPVSGPGRMTKPERERRAKQIIAESGADTEQHLRACQAVTLGTTFQQQSEWWLNHIQTRKRKPVKTRTAVCWKSHLKWINAHMGAVPLADVNNPVVGDLVSALAKQGFSPATMHAYVAVIKMVVASAKNEKGEEIHPRKWDPETMDLPELKKEDQKRPAFTSEQVSKLVAMSATPVLYAVLAGTGMRIGEALALEVGHISPDGLVLQVRQTAWRGKAHSPKTQNAIRDIDLNPELAQLLLTHIGQRSSGLVFPSVRGSMADVSQLTRVHWTLLDKLGIAHTGFHAFRRFRVTQLRKQRIPEDLRRYWLGHADESTTDGYSKVKDDLEFRREVARAIPLGFELPRVQAEIESPFVPTKEPFAIQAVSA